MALPSLPPVVHSGAICCPVVIHRVRLASGSCLTMLGLIPEIRNELTFWQDEEPRSTSFEVPLNHLDAGATIPPIRG